VGSGTDRRPAKRVSRELITHSPAADRGWRKGDRKVEGEYLSLLVGISEVRHPDMALSRLQR